MHSILLAVFATAAVAADSTVIWRLEKSTGKTGITVLQQDKVIASACASTLDTLDFSSVDKSGAGSFKNGDKAFPIISKGDVSCTRMYSKSSRRTE